MKEDSAGVEGGHGAQGDPASPGLPPSSGHETAAPAPALIVREERKAAKLARPRIDGVLAHRMERFRKLVEERLIKSAKDVAMKDYAFMTDDELDRATYLGKALTKRQKRIAREWEKNKRDAPLALHASQEMVVNAMRAQQVQPGVTVNVERAVIRVPETRPEESEEPLVIDVEATLAPG